MAGSKFKTDQAPNWEHNLAFMSEMKWNEINKYFILQIVKIVKLILHNTIKKNEFILINNKDKHKYKLININF